MANKLLSLTLGSQYAIIETEQMDKLNFKLYTVTKVVPVNECTFEYREIDKGHYVVTGKIKRNVSQKQVQEYQDVQSAKDSEQEDSTYTRRH